MSVETYDIVLNGEIILYPFIFIFGNTRLPRFLTPHLVKTSQFFIFIESLCACSTLLQVTLLLRLLLLITATSSFHYTNSKKIQDNVNHCKMYVLFYYQ